MYISRKNSEKNCKFNESGLKYKLFKITRVIIHWTCVNFRSIVKIGAIKKQSRKIQVIEYLNGPQKRNSQNWSTWTQVVKLSEVELCGITDLEIEVDFYDVAKTHLEILHNSFGKCKENAFLLNNNTKM